MFKCAMCSKEYGGNASLQRHNCKLAGVIIIKNKEEDKNKSKNKDKISIQCYNELSISNISLTKKLIKYKNKYTDTLNKLEVLQKKYDVMIERQMEKEREEHKKQREEWKDIERILLDKIQNKTTINKSDNTIIKIKKITNIYTRTTSELEKIYKEEITPDSIRGGIDNMTKIMVNKTLKNQDGNNMVIISNKSKKTIKYELPSGEIVDDIGCLKMINIHRDIILGQLNYIMKDDSISFDEKIDMNSKICVGLFDIKDEDKLNQWGASLIKNL